MALHDAGQRGQVLLEETGEIGRVVEGQGELREATHVDREHGRVVCVPHAMSSFVCAGWKRTASTALRAAVQVSPSRAISVNLLSKCMTRSTSPDSSIPPHREPI